MPLVVITENNAKFTRVVSKFEHPDLSIQPQIILEKTDTYHGEYIIALASSNEDDEEEFMCSSDPVNVGVISLREVLG